MVKSKKKLFLLIGGILAIIAFVLSFFINVHYDMESNAIVVVTLKTTVYYKGAIWGAKFTDALNSGWTEMSESANPAVLSMIGYILVAVVGLFAVALSFLDGKKLSRLVIFALVGALLVGTVFVYMPATSFKASNPDLFRLVDNTIVYQFGNWATGTSGLLCIASMVFMLLSLKYKK